MKARIIKTKFWSDREIRRVSPNARFLLMYLLTSQYIGMTNYFECPDSIISFETGLSAAVLTKAKEELQESCRAYFYDDWVFIPNLEKHNNYKNSPRNLPNYQKEISDIPNKVLDCFNSLLHTSIDTSIDSSMHTDLKSEIRNKKSEKGGVGGKVDHVKIIKEISQEVIEEIAEKYHVPVSFIESKRDDMLNWHEQDPTRNVKKNWIATLRAWTKKDAIETVQKQSYQSDKYKVKMI